MWADYLHHLFLHFPIAGSLLLSIAAFFYLRREESDGSDLLALLTWGGRLVTTCTVLAMVTGIVAAPGWLGGDGPLELDHHRNMGLTVACVAIGTTTCFELGLRQNNRYLLRLGSVLWFAVFFGAVGTGHWGGSVVHSDRIPWDGSEPTIDTLDSETLEAEANDAP
jgi:hypothetical protein